MHFKTIDLKPIYGIAQNLRVEVNADWLAMCISDKAFVSFVTDPRNMSAKPVFDEVSGQYIPYDCIDLDMFRAGVDPHYGEYEDSLRYIRDCPDMFVNGRPESPKLFGPNAPRDKFGNLYPEVFRYNETERGGNPSPWHEWRRRDVVESADPQPSHVNPILDLEPLYGIKEQKHAPALGYTCCSLEYPNILWFHRGTPTYRPELQGWRCGGVGENDYKSIPVFIYATVDKGMVKNSLRYINGLRSNVPEVTSDVKAIIPDIECVSLPNNCFDYDPVNIIDYVRKQAEVYPITEVCAYLRELTALGKLSWAKTESTDGQGFHFAAVGRDLGTVGLTITPTVDGGDAILSVDSVRYEIRGDVFVTFIACAADVYRRSLGRNISASSIDELVNLTSENKCTWIIVNDVLVTDVPRYGVCILDVSSPERKTLYVGDQSLTVANGCYVDDLSLLRIAVFKQLDDVATKKEDMRDIDKTIIKNLVTLTKSGGCKWTLSDSKYVGVTSSVLFILDTTDRLSLKLSAKHGDVIESYESRSNARVVGFDYGLQALCKLVMSPEVTSR